MGCGASRLLPPQAPRSCQCRSLLSRSTAGWPAFEAGSYLRLIDFDLVVNLYQDPILESQIMVVINYWSLVISVTHLGADVREDGFAGQREEALPSNGLVLSQSTVLS